MESELADAWAQADAPHAAHEALLQGCRAQLAAAAEREGSLVRELEDARGRLQQHQWQRRQQQAEAVAAVPASPPSESLDEGRGGTLLLQAPSPYALPPLVDDSAESAAARGDCHDAVLAAPTAAWLPLVAPPSLPAPSAAATSDTSTLLHLDASASDTLSPTDIQSASVAIFDALGAAAAAHALASRLPDSPPSLNGAAAAFPDAARAPVGGRLATLGPHARASPLTPPPSHSQWPRVTSASADTASPPSPLLRAAQAHAQARAGWGSPAPCSRPGRPARSLLVGGAAAAGAANDAACPGSSSSHA